MPDIVTYAEISRAFDSWGLPVTHTEDMNLLLRTEHLKLSPMEVGLLVRVAQALETIVCRLHPAEQDRLRQEAEEDRRRKAWWLLWDEHHACIRGLGRWFGKIWLPIPSSFRFELVRYVLHRVGFRSDVIDKFIGEDGSVARNTWDAKLKAAVAAAKRFNRHDLPETWSREGTKKWAAYEAWRAQVLRIGRDDAQEADQTS